MAVVDVLTVVYLAAFQLCGLWAILRVRRRRSSQDLSLWREGFIVVGVVAQAAVMVLTDADWRVVLSPVTTLAVTSILIGVILWYR